MADHPKRPPTQAEICREMLLAGAEPGEIVVRLEREVPWFKNDPTVVNYHRHMLRRAGLLAEAPDE